MEAASTTVISVGSNPELLWLRNFVLQSAGFQTVTTADEHDAAARIERGECGVLLVCYSLAKSVRQRLAEALRRFCPGSRIIVITNEPMERPDFADAFVYGVEGPEALIEAVGGAIETSGLPKAKVEN